MFAQVITLEKDKRKRKRLCKYISNNLGISCYSFSGTLGKATSLQQHTRYITPLFSQFGPPSAIGCAMSHIKVYEKFLRTDAKYCVVCEDDIQFTKQSNAQFSKLKYNLASVAYDIIYLGCFESPLLTSLMRCLNMTNKTEAIDNNMLRSPEVSLGLHGYLISRSGAVKLLKALKGNVFTHIDFCIQTLIVKRELNVAVMNPRIAYQTSTDDISKSSNISESSVVINRLMKDIYIDTMVRFNYITNVSLLQWQNVKLTVYSVLCLIIGLVLGNISTFKNLLVVYLLLNLGNSFNVVLVMNFVVMSLGWVVINCVV